MVGVLVGVSKLIIGGRIQGSPNAVIQGVPTTLLEERDSLHDSFHVYNILGKFVSFIFIWS